MSNALPLLTTTNIAKSYGPVTALASVDFTVRRGETLQAAAAREAGEETGLTVEVGPVVWVGETIGPGDPPAWHHVIVDFRAVVTGGTLAAGDDAADVRWVPVGELDALPLGPTMRELAGLLEEA